MKRSLIWGIAGLALFASLLFASAALAAPTLEVEVTHSPETINRGDEFLSYEVKVKNSSATEPASGTLGLALGLPPGLTLKAVSGTGWSCSIATLLCTSSTTVAAGGSYPPLKLSEIWIDETAPDTVTATAEASLLGAPSATGSDSFSFGPRTPFGLLITEAHAFNEAFEDETQAGGHPYEAVATFRTTQHTGPGTQINGNPNVVPVEDLRGGVSELPPGVVGNPQAAGATCRFADVKAGNCPTAAAVGYTNVFFRLIAGAEPEFEGKGSEIVYRLPHEKGYPASFAFKTIGPAFVVRTKVRSDGDYGISAVIPLVPQIPAVFGARFAFCGYGVSTGGVEGVHCKGLTEPEPNLRAFITNGTDCAAGAPLTRFGVDSWQHPGAIAEDGLPDLYDPNWSILDFHSPVLTGCGRLTEEWTGQHEPSFSMQPETHAADSPAAYTADLKVPQEGLEDPEGLGTAHLKDTTVTLPAGVSFNPAIGDGLKACTEAQIGYLGNEFPAPNHIRFDTQVPSCPAASKVGTAKIHTPLLEEPLHGSVYLAAQHENPFGSNYAIYLAVEEPEIGIVLKLPGEVTPDPGTGQITAVFKDNPQLPFDDLELSFFGGPRSALANPVTCGSFTTGTELTPWSAVDPENPQPSEIAKPTDQISIDSGPGGSACPASAGARPFNLGFQAGAQNPLAGSTSPFSFQITRPDGAQEISTLDLTPPPGFTAYLKGVPYCTEAQIQAAEHNRGRAEQAGPSCPAASQIGTTEVGAGAGPSPFYVPGRLYLAGPYKGAPLSAVAITPAVAGPFDLGDVVVRSALHVNPETAQITAKTDPVPRILEGIPLRIRDIRVNLDRPDWALNPTSCEPMSVQASVSSTDGGTANLSNPFQVHGCENLPFKPNLKLQVLGGTRRDAKPKLKAVLTAKPGEANIARAQVNLPHSEFLEQNHIKTVCTRVQFAEGNGNGSACPAGSIYGKARAWSPLLEKPLEGDVYLRSNGGERKLPDLVAALDGQVNIALWGKVDSGPNHGIRNTFEVVPDAPVSRFVLEMNGGKKGLLVNSENLCSKKAKRQAIVRFTGQNGKVHAFKPLVQNQCPKKVKVTEVKWHGKKGKKKKAGHGRANPRLAALLRPAGAGW